MYFVHRFEPHRLPDTRHRSVPNAFRSRYLFPPGLVSFVCRIPHPDYQRIHASLFQCRRNIKRKRSETTAMASYSYAIHPYLSFPVHRTEMQQHPAFPPFRRNFKRTMIKQLVFLTHFFTHSRQGRLYGKRYKNLPVERSRSIAAFFHYRIIPQSV